MKNLETYRKKMKKKLNVFFSIYLSIYLISFGLLPYLPLPQGKENVTDMITGFFTGVGLVFVFRYVWYSKKIKNNRELEKMYIKEHDERELLIRRKSGADIIMPLDSIIVVVGLMTGYFNEVVGFTLIGVALFQMILSASLKFYWSKKLS